MEPRTEKLAIGEWGKPGRTNIGDFEVTALWRDDGRIEAKLWCDGGKSYDDHKAIRIFKDESDFAEFLQGLRDGKWPKPLGPEHDFISAMVCNLGDDTWIDRERRENVVDTFRLPPLPEDHDCGKLEWDE